MTVKNASKPIVLLHRLEAMSSKLDPDKAGGFMRAKG
jgi:hypothetical protein